MIDDPLGLIVQGIFLLAAGMYPVGFLFGACSECCDQCRNDSCADFTLDEAMSVQHPSTQKVFCGFEVEDNVLKLIGEQWADDAWGSDGYLPTKGCRVTGDGIEEGTVVTELSRLYDGEPEFGPVQGCCSKSVTYDVESLSGMGGNTPTKIGEETKTNIHISSEDDCTDDFAFLSAQQGGGFEQKAVGDTIPLPAVFVGGGFQNRQARITSIEDASWDECEQCYGATLLNQELLIRSLALNSNSVRRQVVSWPNFIGWTITLNKPPIGPVDCLTFCGSSGMCGPYINEAWGPYGGGPEGRRNCVRWMCRCYESTGKRSMMAQDMSRGCCTTTHKYRVCSDGVPEGSVLEGINSYIATESECQDAATFFENNSCEQYGIQTVSFESSWNPGFDCNADPIYSDEPAFPDPGDWYTVISSDVVGGPTTNNLDLSDALDAATENGRPLEHELFGSGYTYGDFASQPEGYKRCFVFAFVFYGDSNKVPPDRCRWIHDPRKTITSRDNHYTINICDRCQ
jgi:hypothetical protein